MRYISDEPGIPRATLHGWKKQFALLINDKEAINTPAESWSPEEKFADNYSRKIVGWEVYNKESGDNAATIVERSVWAER